MKKHRAVYCQINRFKSQMWFLHFFRYHIISIEDLVSIIEGKKKIPLRGVVLTFDDGYCNFYSNAYPVLKKYNYPAVVYVISSLIGKRVCWFEQGRDTPPLMDLHQLQSLSLKGIEIGSHGKTHVKLGEVQPQKAWEEIFDSKKRLEKLLNISIDHFCYPYGNFTQKTKEMVRKAGYKSAVTCIRGGVRVGGDLFEIPRKAISYGDNVIGMWWKLHFKNSIKKK